jgi:HSP20 family protein
MDTATKGNIPVSNGKKAAVKSSTWPALQHPILEMERAFDRFLDRNWSVDNLFQVEGLRMPNLDVVDRDKELIVRAEIPGIDKKDIKVSLVDNVLTIKGQTSNEEREEKGDYYRNEISSSSFARSVTVPTNVDITKAAANLKDGILEIKLPKVESSKCCNIAVQ